MVQRLTYFSLQMCINSFNRSDIGDLFPTVKFKELEIYWILNLSIKFTFQSCMSVPVLKIGNAEILILAIVQ